MSPHVLVAGLRLFEQALPLSFVHELALQPLDARSKRHSSPMSRQGRTARIDAHQAHPAPPGPRFGGSLETTGADGVTGLIIFHSPEAETIDLIFALRTLCALPQEFLKRIERVDVRAPASSEYSPVDSFPPCGASLTYTSEDEDTGWSQSLLNAASTFGTMVSTIVVMDSRVQLLSSSLAPLLTLCTTDGANAAAGIVLYPDGTLHASAYSSDPVPVNGADYLLPVSRDRGYPTPLPKAIDVRNRRRALLPSGLVVAFRRQVLTQLGRDGNVSQSWPVCSHLVLCHADLFLALRTHNIEVRLSWESRVIVESSETSTMQTTMDSYSAAESAVHHFTNKWANNAQAALRPLFIVERPVRWLMHCAGSMGGEALYMLAGINGMVPVRTQVVRPLPDCEHLQNTIKGAPRGLQDAYHRLSELGPADSGVPEVVIYHRDYRSLGEYIEYTSTAYVVVRYMFEGSGTLHQEMISQVKAVDEVWVPSEFHREVFADNGVPPSKVYVVPEATDATLMHALVQDQPPIHIDGARGKVFLSVFKFEDRKGWRELVHAWCLAFTAADDVTLVLRTYVPNHGDYDGGAAEINARMTNYLDSVGCKMPRTPRSGRWIVPKTWQRPAIMVIGIGLSGLDMLRLYNSAYCYVSAHWGEGWSLPLAEAMSMGLPAIATNFSGNRGFMTANNSWLIDYTLEPYELSDQWFGGLLHARADVTHLSRTMRRVHHMPNDASRRGQQGMHDMMRRFSPAAVGSVIVDRLKAIDAKLKQRSQRTALDVAGPKLFDSANLHAYHHFHDPPEVRVCLSGPQSGDQAVLQAPSGRKQKIVILSTYTPKKCGIAMFTSNLFHALRKVRPDLDVEVIAITDDRDPLKYGPEVKMRIRKYNFDDYAAAARYANSVATGLLLQHEFGIFGGADGAYAVCFLKLLRIPTATVLHTVLSRLSDSQRHTLQHLAHLSATIVVMTSLTARMLESSFFVKGAVVIPHGVPLPPTAAMPRLQAQAWRESKRMQLGWSNGVVVIFSNGLIHPDKGYEYVIEAIPKLQAMHKILYVIAGAPHPTAADGKAYVRSLKRLVVKLKVNQSVVFEPQFFTYEELQARLIAADIFVAPYRNRFVSSSGTLSMAMASGLPALATPFFYARSVLQDGRGQLISFSSSAGILKRVGYWLQHPEARRTAGMLAAIHMRNMSWDRVGRQYAQLFSGSNAAHSTANKHSWRWPWG